MSFYINVYSDPENQIPKEAPDFSTADIEDDQTIMFRIEGGDDVSMTGANFKTLLEWLATRGKLQ